MNGSVNTDGRLVSDIVALKYVMMYISVQARRGPEDSQRLRLSDFEKIGT
jgi:hypothetical protein